MKESSFRLLSFSLKTLIDGYRMTVITEQTGQENLSLVGWGILYAWLCWYKSLMILYSHGLYLLWFHLSKQSPGSVLSMTATSERASHSLTLSGADRTVIMASCLQLSSERHSPQVFLVPATSTDLTWPSAAPRFALKVGMGVGHRSDMGYSGEELSWEMTPVPLTWVRSHFLPSRKQAGKESAHRADNAALSPSSSVSEKPDESPPHCLFQETHVFLDLMSWVT